MPGLQKTLFVLFYGCLFYYRGFFNRVSHGLGGIRSRFCGVNLHGSIGACFNKSRRIGFLMNRLNFPNYYLGMPPPITK